MAEEKNVRGDFGHGDVKKLILAQAIPLTMAQLVQLLYNIVDRVYIGHMPGDETGIALTGIGLCFPIITLISSFVNLISSGSAPLCSMARGNQDRKKAQDVLNTAFNMMLIISLSLMAILYLTHKPLLYFLGASDATFSNARDYLVIYLAGTLFFSIGTGMNNFINLQGYPRMGMLTTVIGAVINLILDPIFIFALRLGVRGAAMATVISQLCSAVWVLCYLSGKKMELRLDFRCREIRWYVLKDILKMGIPGFIVGATNTACQSVCNIMLSIHGGDLYIGIMTIINSVREMIGLPIHGVTGGSQPFLSYNYGAKKYDRVKQGIRFATFVGILYTLIFWICTLTIPKVFLTIFSNDAEMIAKGVGPLKVYFMGFIFMSLMFAGQSTFVSLGKSGKATFFSIFRKIVIAVPLTILLPRIPSLGVMGVFLAEPISNFVGGGASFLTMYFTVYRKLPVEEDVIAGK